MDASLLIESDNSAGLSAVVGALVGIIGICAIAAITLAVAHYQDNGKAQKQELEGFGRRRKTDITHVVQASSAMPRVASAASVRSKRPAPDNGRGGGSGSNGGGGGGGADACGGKSCQRPNNSCGSTLSSHPDHIDLGSVYGTQETMDSAMVQEILGSVDANTVRETQALLSTFNWDLDELLQQELSQKARA